MSFMPLTETFHGAVKADPALLGRLGWSAPAANSALNESKKSDFTKQLEEFNRQNDYTISDNYGDTNAKKTDKTDAAYYAKRREYQRFAGTLNSINWESISHTLSRFTSFSLRDLMGAKDDFQADRERSMERHRQAAGQIPVKQQDAALDVNGMPMSRERYEWKMRNNEQCGGHVTADDLVRDDSGRFVMDASGEEFKNAHKQAESDAYLARAQETEKLVARINAGEITYGQLTDDQKLIVMQSKSPEERAALYKTHAVPEQEREALEQSITQYQQQMAPGLLGEIARPATAVEYGDVTLNGGALTPGQFNLNNAFTGAALGMAPVNVHFVAPAASIALQNQMELAPGS